MERFAVWITEHIGTMGFFLIILVWTILWFFLECFRSFGISF